MRKTTHASLPIIATVLTFCVVVFFFVGLEYLERERFHQTIQTKTINKLSQIRASLETEISANFYLTQGLIAYISTNPDWDEQVFQRLARQILTNHKCIRHISIAPDNIVRFVYPLQGNERSVGLDYRNNAEQWPSVARIIASGKTVIAGPVKLVQGGVAFICRTPIFVATDSISEKGQEKGQYWGLASVVIEKERLLKSAGLYNEDLDIQIAMKGEDGLGADGNMIEGDPAIFINTPVLMPVNLPEGSWMLAAVPRGGWTISSPYLIWLRITALITALLLSLVTYSWLRRQETIHRSLETAWLEAKKAQGDLRLNEEFLNTVLDNIPAMIFVKDAQELRFVRFNRTGAELLGYSVSDFLGKNDFDFFPESEARFFVEKDREVLQKGDLVDIPEEPIQTKNHGKKFLHTRKIPIKDAGGHPIYLLGISEDITDQIQGRAETERLGKMLQQAQKLESLGKMAGGVAHDLNNILSGIINYPELLLLQIPPDSPLRKPLKEIHDSGKRAAKVVADLLTIARGVAAVKENICLKNLIEEYLDSPEHRELCTVFPDVSYVVSIEPGIWTTSCSPIHIQKCLMNLINNAAEAFPPGKGGEIIISCRNEERQEALPGFPDIARGRYVVLTVQDHGSGISKSDLEHIFEPFYTRKAMGRSGTGLGLAVVWTTMNDHRGAVTVNSVPGAETTFALFLPATDETITAQPASIALDELYGQGQRILIVDDEPQQRDIASQILKKLRYSVEIAASGEEAVEYLKRHSVDLVILDMIMKPGLSGRETYEKILFIHPGQKAIIASGFAYNEDVTKVQALGAGKYLKKPYTLVQLGSTVQQVLRES